VPAVLYLRPRRLKDGGRDATRDAGRDAGRPGTVTSAVAASTHEQLVSTLVSGAPGVGSGRRPGFGRPAGDSTGHWPGPKLERVQVLATDHQAAGNLVGAEVAEVVRADVGLGVAGEHPGVFGRDVEVHLVAGVRRGGFDKVAGQLAEVWWAKVSDRR